MKPILTAALALEQVAAGASLQRARGLNQGRLNQACGDEATQLPPGLTIPHC